MTAPTHQQPHQRQGGVVTPARAAALDVLFVVVFATVGRSSHSEGITLLGVAGVAWPFLVGAAAGWALVRARSHQWPLEAGPGVLVWAGTLVLGMLLRAVTGAGVAVSFVLVAGLFLALTLVGWRSVVPRLPRVGTRS